MKIRLVLLSLVLCAATAAIHAHGPGGSGPSGPPPGPPGPPYNGPLPPKGGATTGNPEKGPGNSGTSGKGGSTGGGAIRARSGGSPAAGAGAKPAARGGTSAISGLSGLTDQPNAWELWWDHNKDPFVMRRSTTRRASSGSSGALTARGRSSRPTSDPVEELRPQIIAALQQVLQTEQDPELCDSATLALARVSAADLAHLVDPDIRKGLQHDTNSVRTSATLSLGVLGASRSLPLLNALMADTSAGRAAVGGGQVPWNVRAYAALSLGLINEPLAVEPLLDLALTAPASAREVRAAAVTALGLLEFEDPAPLVTGLLEVLGADGMDPVVRACAVNALGRLGDVTALPTLIKAFRLDKSEQVVRQSLAQALGMLGSLRQEQTVTLLSQCVVKDSDAAARQFAWIALGRLGAGAGGDVLDPAQQALVKQLVDALKSPPHATDRSWVALAAGLFGAGNPAAAQALRDPLIDAYASGQDPALKSACAVALGLCGADGQADALLADLESSKDPALRGYLAVSLGLLGHRDAAPALVTLCREKAISDTVRQQVAGAIAMLGEGSAAPLLLEELSGTNSLEYASSMSRALGQLRDPRSIGPLMALAQDPSQRIVARAFACVALGLIGDKLDLRFNTRIEQDYNYLAGATTIDEIVGL